MFGWFSAVWARDEEASLDAVFLQQGPESWARLPWARTRPLSSLRACWRSRRRAPATS